MKKSLSNLKILENKPHRRFNALTGEWILVSPQRTDRPWQGRVEKTNPSNLPRYDPNCYLCPGNQRAGGEFNPNYSNTNFFTNDFPALLPETHFLEDSDHSLIKIQGVGGTCKVVCFSPRHDLTLPEMETDEIRKVVDLWCDQVHELGNIYRWVQIFENKGEIMGCSNPHPHGQIWAMNQIPNEAIKENLFQKSYFSDQGAPLLIDYTQVEDELGIRIVVENTQWIALVPFWAIWPFETILIPRRHIQRLSDLDNSDKMTLVEILKSLLIKYDNLFETSFPYSMGWHGAPTDDEDYSHWQLHAHFFPPLLRTATIKKFMVGFEMLAEAQRDLTAEHAVDQLRKLSPIHFKNRA